MPGLLRRVVPAAARRQLRRAMFEWLQLTWTTPSGIGLRVRSYNEWIIYNEVFVDGEYDAAIEAAISARSDDRPMCVLDLGANIGFFTLRLFDRLRAAGLTDTSCAATLVEANPDLIPRLRARLHDSGLTASVRIVHGLAGEPAGEAMLFRAPDADGDSSTLRPTADGVPVQYVDLTPLLSTASVIDLLKCDIEGSELTVLERYPELLSRTRVAVIEHHHDLCPVERCRELLRAAGLVHETLLRDRGGCSLRLYERTAVPRFQGS